MCLSLALFHSGPRVAIGTGVASPDGDDINRRDFNVCLGFLFCRFNFLFPHQPRKLDPSKISPYCINILLWINKNLAIRTVAC